MERARRASSKKPAPAMTCPHLQVASRYHSRHRARAVLYGRTEARTAQVGDITQLLRAANAGDRAAADRLFSLMYEELKGLAHRSLRNSGRAGELNTTMLVHESFLKLT